MPIGTVEAGSDFTFVLTLVDQDEVAVDLTGATVTADVHIGGAHLVEDASVGITTALSGIVTYTVTDAVSGNWPAGNATLHIKAALASALVRRWTDTFTIIRNPGI